MEKVHLLGLDFWNAKNEEEVATYILENKNIYKGDNIGFLITPNAFEIAQFFTKYQSIYQEVRKSVVVVLADGISIVLLSRLYSHPLKTRLAGSTLFPVLWEKIKSQRKKAFFILPSVKMVEKLQMETPDAQFVIPDFFQEQDNEYVTKFVNSFIETLKTFRPDFIFIGITTPKQQKLALELHAQLSGKVDFKCMIATLGASFEFYLGFKKRAPVFFQKTGLEWLYRFCQEPKRLWKRYTIGNMQFIYIALKEVLRKRKRLKNDAS